MMMWWIEKNEKRRTHHKSFNYMCAEQRHTHLLGFRSFEPDRKREGERKRAGLFEKNEEINEWWHFWWIRIDNRRHFMLLNISTSHKQTSLAIFHIMQSKFHAGNTITIICVSLSLLQFFLFHFFFAGFFFASCSCFSFRGFYHHLVHCVELLAWKSFHLWNFSTCFFRNDWRQDTASDFFYSWLDVSAAASICLFNPLRKKRDGIKNVNFDSAINPFSSIFRKTKRISYESVQQKERKSVFKHSVIWK